MGVSDNLTRLFVFWGDVDEFRPICGAFNGYFGLMWMVDVFLRLLVNIHWIRVEGKVLKGVSIFENHYTAETGKLKSRTDLVITLQDSIAVCACKPTCFSFVSFQWLCMSVCAISSRMQVILSLVPATSGDSNFADEQSSPCRSPLSSNDDDVTSATCACWILEYGVCSPNLFPSLSVDQLAKCLEVYAFLGLPLPSQWQQQLMTHLNSRTDLSTSSAATTAMEQDAGDISRHNEGLGLEREPWVRLVTALAAALTEDSQPHYQHFTLNGANPLLRILVLLPSLDLLRQRDSFLPKVDHLRACVLAEVANAMSACSSESVLPLLPDIIAVAERWSEVYLPRQHSYQGLGQFQNTAAGRNKTEDEEADTDGSLQSDAAASGSSTSEDSSTDNSLHSTSTELTTTVAVSMLASCLAHVDSALTGETLPRTCIADALAALSPFVEHAAGGKLIGREGHHPVAVVDRWLDMMTLATPRSQSPVSCSVAMLTVSKLLGDSPDASHISAQRRWCFETTEM